MNLHPDDPRLSAFMLGELPADEAAAVADAVAADPALQAALHDMTNLQQLLTETLVTGSNTLTPLQRETIRRAARQAPGDAVPHASGTRQRSWKPWLVPLAAAAAITLAALVFVTLADRRRSASANHATASAALPPDTPRPESRPLPAPGPADAGIPSAAAPATPAAGTGFPALHRRGPLTAADFPTLALPVLAGDASWGWIRDSIRIHHQLPPRDAVRLEEILQRLALRPNGLTVVARHPANNWHPDDRGSGTTTHAASIATETLACPWQPAASLVLVSIRGNPFSDCDITAVFRANPANVRHYRLLGFAPAVGHPPRPLPTRLPAKTNTLLVIEVEPATPTGELGAIEWSVNGHPAAPVLLTRRGEAEPSDDARFAALVCAFGQWLAGEASAMVAPEVVAALAREAAAASLPPERADFLELVAEALNL